MRRSWVIDNINQMVKNVQPKVAHSISILMLNKINNYCMSLERRIQKKQVLRVKMEEMELEQYIFPIYSGGSIIGQGFIADGYFITAAHLVTDFPSCYVNIRGKILQLTKEIPFYIGEGFIHHDPNTMDVAIFPFTEIDSPLSFAEYIPKMGDEFESYCMHQAMDFRSLNPPCELKHVPAIVNTEEVGNYFYCNCKQYGGSIGSPLLDGIKVVGVMHGGNNNDLCTFLKAKVVKKVIREVKEEMENVWVDEYGVKYSADGMQLLSASSLSLLDVTIKEYSIKKGTQIIGDSAFFGCNKLTSVVIPEGVISIGDSAFAYCENLTSIIIPEGVKLIGDGAFQGCEKMDSLSIPDSVIIIGDDAFEDCCSLKSIYIPDGVTCIGNCAFWGCSSLKSVHLSNNVISIGAFAFCECDNITSLYLPDSITSIGEEAFGNCNASISFIIPHGSRAKFEKILLEYKDKLKELDHEEDVSSRIADGDMSN